MPIADLLQQAFQLHSAGKIAEAAALYQSVLSQDSGNPDALHLLGVCEYQSGCSQRAVELITAAIGTGVFNPMMHSNLGAAWTALNQNEKALACYNEAARLAPQAADVYYNRGNVQKSLGNLPAAVADYRQCLQLNPKYVQAHNNLGTALVSLGQLEDALRSYQRTIELQPDYFRAYCNLGWIHHKLGRAVEAQAAYQKAIQINPQYAEAYNNLGSLYFEQGHPEAALTCYEKALKFDPNLFDAQCGKGAVLAQQGKVDEARAAQERALQIRPNDGLKVRQALLTYVVPQSEQEMIAARRHLEAECERLLKASLKVDDPVHAIGATPFHLAYQGLNEVESQRKIARLLLHAAPMLEFTSPHCRKGPIHPAPGRKPRIGFISKYFYDHPVGKHYAGIIRELSHERFQLLVLRPTVPDDAVAREIASAGHQTITLDFDLVRARQQIAALEIDVLVYADVGMDPWTNYLACARLAPIQCVLGGHPVTTGLPTMDYFISSRLMEPDNAQEHYSERLVLLDHLPNFYRRPNLPEPRKSLADLGLPETGHRYVTCQTLFKYHPADDELFGQILRADPAGRLFFFCGRHANWTQLIQQRLQRSLADVYDRVQFLSRMQGPDYLQVLAQADALLDTPRFSGGTTTCDALGVGAPVVTLPGPFLRSRVTLGAYRQMGVLDLIAKDREDYVRLAVRLGVDDAWREEVRRKILAANHALFENTACIGELNEIFARWTAQ